MEGWKLSVSVLKAMLLLFVYTVRVNAQEITTFAGSGEGGYNGDKLAASQVAINKVTAAVTDAYGNLYYADMNNNRIRKVNTDGVVETIAGTGMAGYTPDGGLAINAAISQPAGIAIDKEGNIYFSEYINACVRKISRNGILSTVAGGNGAGFSGNGGLATAARLQGPGAIVMDKEGNLYISDGDNNCVRKVSTTGIITMYAGNGKGYGTGRGGYSGDGGKATAAELNQPGALALDDKGNLYISDCFNHCIRKVGANGIITTFAGSGTGGYAGDNGKATKAQLNFPEGIAIGAGGNLYIADHANNRIRMVNTDGVITTVAGTGSAVLSGDNGPASMAGIGKPSFVILSNNNTLFIGDNANNRIRMIKDNKEESITKAVPAAGAAHRATVGAVSAAASGGTQ